MANYPYRDLGIMLDLDNWEALNRNFDDIENDMVDVNKRLKNVITGSSPGYTEVVDARYSINEQFIYPTLKQRIDAEVQATNEKLLELGGEMQAPVPGSKVEDGSIASSKLRTATDAEKIKLVHLSAEVQAAMAGTSPVISSVADRTLTREKLALEAVSIDEIDKETRKNVEFTTNRINETMTRGLTNQFATIGNIVTANATATITSPTGVVPNDEGRNVQFAFTNASASHFSVQNIALATDPPVLGFWMKKSELLAAESVLELYPTLWFQNSGGSTLLNIALDGASGAPVLKANALTKVGTKFSYLKEGVTLYFESLAELGDYIYWVAYTDIVFPSATKCRFFVSLARKTQAITLNFFDPFWSKTKYKLVPRYKSQQTAPASVLAPYPINKYQNKRAVTLGDSITWQDAKAYSWNGVVARGYQTIMKERLGFSEILNIGVSGRPMANGTANGVGTNTTGKTVDYATYDLTTIAAGTNDFKLDVPLGSLGVIGDTTFDTNTFYGAYRDLIEYILTQKPSEKIVLFTPLQRDNGGYTVNTTNAAGHKLIDYVNAIKAVGQMYSLPVVDLYAESGLTKLNLATYTWDGLHPNDFGYERMSENIIGTLITK